jgi:hypothetical protein
MTESSISANAYVNILGKVFELLRPHVRDSPPLPVEDHLDEFIAFVNRYDLICIPPLCSAYPGLSVLHVLTLEKQAGQS